jgi:hypothetical protein
VPHGPTEPTGEEHLTPVLITDTSATERAVFRQCRRRWFLTVVHRLDPEEGNPNFFVGNLFHSGLQRYYEGIRDGESHDEATERALDAYQIEFEVEMEKLREQLKFLWPVAQPQWRELGELGFEMVQNYLDREGRNPMFDEIVAVEFRVNVDIPDRLGNSMGKLSVQADVIGRKDGELKVADHKTASRDVTSAHLDIDDQLTAEVFAWWRHSGQFPERAVYNVAYKKSFGPPRQIRGSKEKPVKLSKDKSQGTTYALYRQEIERLGLDKGDYVDILTALKEREDRGEDALFHREEVFRSLDQLEAFERDLYWEFRDMQDVAAEPERAYPNPTKFNCPNCPVRVICFAIQDGGDVPAIIRGGFVVAEPRR